jgi:hypothetical protein
VTKPTCRYFLRWIAVQSVISVLGFARETIASEPELGAEPSAVETQGAASRTDRPSIRVPTGDAETRSLSEALKRTEHDGRRTFLTATREKLRPENFSAFLVTVSLSDEPVARDSALDFLWNSGGDGERAAAIACAIRYRLVAPHLSWLLGRIDPRDKLSASYLEMLSSHDNPQILGEVVQAAGRLHLDDRAVVDKLTALLEQSPDLNVRLQAVVALQKNKRNDREMANRLEEIHRGLQSQIWQKDFDEALETLRSCIAEEKLLREKTRLEAVRFLREP